MAEPNVGDLVASTLRHYVPGLNDNVMEHNAFANALKKEGGLKKVVSGGRNISEFVLHGTNSSAKFFEGYETFVPPTDDQDVLDLAEYEPKQLGGFVAVSSREVMQNRGKERLQEFIKVRIKQLEANLMNTFAASLYSDGTGTGGKEIGGLQLLVQDDPTSSSTVGGINQNTFSFWRNKTTSALTVTSATIEGDMLGLWLDIIRGNDQPTHIFADSSLFTLYWEALVDKRRYMDANEAEGSFKSLAFEGARVYFDDQCPTKRMYFLNMKDLCLRVYNDDASLFRVEKPRDITNALYSVTPVHFMGNLTTGRRASHGVLIDD